MPSWSSKNSKVSSWPACAAKWRAFRPLPSLTWLNPSGLTCLVKLVISEMVPFITASNKSLTVSLAARAFPASPLLSWSNTTCTNKEYQYYSNMIYDYYLMSTILMLIYYFKIYLSHYHLKVCTPLSCLNFSHLILILIVVLPLLKWLVYACSQSYKTFSMFMQEGKFSLHPFWHTSEVMSSTYCWVQLTTIQS